MVTKELIERFFRNECSAEEQQQVADYFSANADEFAKYLDENEWEQFKTAAQMDAAVSKRLFENIQKQTTKKTGTLRIMRRVAAAAVVLLLAGLGWRYLNTGSREPQVAAAKPVTANSIAIITRHETNHTGRNKTIQLEDGSLIILSNNSEIVYQLPFTNARNIRVAGKAFFKVAKDKTKPFTVTSGPITTTALGTAFTVAADKDLGHIVVRLYEGKVVIKAVNKSDRHMRKDIYLMPGQEFVYAAEAPVRKHAFNINSTTAPEEIMAQETEADDPSLPQNNRSSWFQFNNRPVSEVFDQLAEIYKVKIVYDKKDVQNIYFIGKYNSTDSVETILKRISTLNHLTITRNDTAYIISK